MTEKMAPRCKAQRAESRRQQVLEAAVVCFRRSGFRGASMSDISALAGMSTGHIYHYFKSKEAIVEAIVERDLQQGQVAIDVIKESDDVVGTLIEATADCIVDRNRFSDPALLLEIFAEASRNPTVSTIMTDCRTAIRQSLLDTLESGRKQGSISADADIEVACTMLMLIYDGITVQSTLSPSFRREAILQQVELLLTRILRPVPGQTSLA